MEQDHGSFEDVTEIVEVVVVPTVKHCLAYLSNRSHRPVDVKSKISFCATSLATLGTGNEPSGSNFEAHLGSVR